ncbi:MAG: S8 family serine peptidase [Candidatus Riflebacteria bacterium]|nr:S8 family serine peptidase [Candidatus Riflebacteria bacterium]
MVKFRIEFTPLWIANAAITATKSEISEIANLPNVDRLSPDRLIQGISPGKDWNPAPAEEKHGTPWSAQKVRVPEVWSELQIDGTGVIVGHLDSGVFEAHPALTGKILKFKDFTPAAKPVPYDDQGHGTHTAGSIVGSNGVGVALGAKLIVGKIFQFYRQCF